MKASDVVKGKRKGNGVVRRSFDGAVVVVGGVIGRSEGLE